MNTQTNKAFLTSFASDHSAGTAAARAAGGIGRLWAAWREQRARARAIDDLLRLDDRLLTDMGVQRWELRERVDVGRVDL
jgi:uncharacterized protein YjiS (DUF1127 family)